MRILFLTQFQAAVKYAPPVTTLDNIKQREGETLHAYFKRFNVEATSVRGATDKTLKSFLIAGMQVGIDLWKHLQGKDPSTLAELYAQDEPYKRVEQSLVENKKVDSTKTSKYKNKKREKSPSPENRGRGRSPKRVNVENTKRNWSPPSSYETYTPLTAPLIHIFELNKGKTIFKKPEPLNSF